MSYERDLQVHYDATHKRLLNGRRFVKTDPPLVPQPVVDKSSPEALLLRIEALEEIVRTLTVWREPASNSNPHNPQERYPTVDDIFQLVRIKENYRPNLLLGSQRQPDLVRARQMIYYLAATRTTKSYKQIGHCLAGRDHTTIMHGKLRIERLRAFDMELDSKLQWYEAELNRLTEERSRA